MVQSNLDFIVLKIPCVNYKIYDDSFFFQWRLIHYCVVVYDLCRVKICTITHFFTDNLYVPESKLGVLSKVHV